MTCSVCCTFRGFQSHAWTVFRRSSDIPSQGSASAFWLPKKRMPLVFFVPPNTNQTKQSFCCCFRRKQTNKQNNLFFFSRKNGLPSEWLQCLDLFAFGGFGTIGAMACSLWHTCSPRLPWDTSFVGCQGGLVGFKISFDAWLMAKKRSRLLGSKPQAIAGRR